MPASDDMDDPERRQSTISMAEASVPDSQADGSPSIWRQMAYVPPRGPCGFKYSMMSPACTCLRFMIHPAKAASSFECDGCSHHASYHALRSTPDEQVVASRWRQVDGTFDRESYDLDEEVQEVRARRRQFGIENDMTSNHELTMPAKAKSTLMESGRKRARFGINTT